MGFEIGIGGSRLSPAQRQKLAIARALLKQPELMIVDQATAALDPSGRAAMRLNLAAACDGKGLLWVLPDLAEAGGFTHVIVMDNGRVTEQGPLQAVLGKREPAPAAK
jgi:ABC-type multidrug transport system fused ATPase/permease subunit